MEKTNPSTNFTDNKEHPLLNSVVLKQVFQYLNPTTNLETLKTLRQVCTVWRDVSLSCWRKTAVLQLFSDRRVPLHCPPYLVTTFTRLMFQLQNPVNFYRFEEQPFQQYKLKDTTIDIVYAFEQGTKACTFWQFLGFHVHHLILDNVTFLTGLTSCRREDLIQFLIQFFPNLKTLTVKQVGFQKREWDLKGDDDFLALTPVLSKVTSLKIDGCKYFNLDNFPNLKNLTLDKDICLKATIPIENSTVTSLAVICPENNSRRSPRFKLLALQNLSVRLAADMTAISDYLPKLLRKHGETLKTLEVLGWPWPLHGPYNKFPFKCQLDQLTELKLWGNVTNNLGFLRWMPKLKLLYWDLHCLEKQKELRNIYNDNEENYYTQPIRHDIVEEAMSRRRGMEQVVLPDLHQLQINCGFEMNSLKKLGEWMPNVKTVKIVLWPGSIGVIGDQWPLLEHLVGLHGSTIRDEDLRGFADGKGLLDLQLLRTFHVHSSCNEGVLTDALVDPVFLEMASLKDLEFCASTVFSGAAEARLNERISKVKVIRNYTTNKEHVNWECCRNKEFMQFLQENASSKVRNYSEDDDETDSEESTDDDDSSESDTSEAEIEEVEQQE